MTGAGIVTLRRDTRGAALVEFAIVLPVLLLLFLGGYQLSDAIACKRKVTIMTRAIGDITSQYRALTMGEADTLLAASAQILAPYPAAPARLRVSQISVESDGLNFRIDWSRGRGIDADTPGRYPASTLPAAYRQPGMVFIRTQASYDYASLFPNYFNAIRFSEDIWLLPRRSATITLT